MQFIPRFDNNVDRAILSNTWANHWPRKMARFLLDLAFSLSSICVSILQTHCFGGTMSKTSLPKIHGELAQDPYASLIEEYLLTLFQEEYSVLTLRHYGWHLHQLGKWLVDRGISKPCEANRNIMRRWGAELREKYQPRTQKQAIAAARSFFQWLVTEEICSSNPASVLRTPRIKITSQRTRV